MVEDTTYIEKMFYGRKLMEGIGVWLYRRDDDTEEWVVYHPVLGFIHSVSLLACYTMINEVNSTLTFKNIEIS